jgi:hypothetical protein
MIEHACLACVAFNVRAWLGRFGREPDTYRVNQTGARLLDETIAYLQQFGEHTCEVGDD